MADILTSQGLALEKKKLIISIVVEVADGFHFYYNTEAGDDKLATAEVFNIGDSTGFES
jgi:hypothetical protein